MKKFLLFAFFITVLVSIFIFPLSVHSEDESSKDSIYLTLEISEKEVFMNDKIPIKLILHAKGLSLRDIQYPIINNDYIQLDEYAESKQYQKQINGSEFDIIEFNTNVVFKRIGEIEVGPAELMCNIVKKSPEGYYEKKPISVYSDAISINIKNSSNNISEVPRDDQQTLEELMYKNARSALEQLDEIARKPEARQDLNSKFALEQIAEFEKSGLLKKMEIPINRAYVDSVKWRALNFDRQERVGEVLLLYFDDMNGYSRGAGIYDYNSGNKLAEYTLLGLEVY